VGEGEGWGEGGANDAYKICGLENF